MNQDADSNQYLRCFPQLSWGIITLIIAGGLFSGTLSAKPLEKSLECLVCGGKHHNVDQVVKYKGMDLPLCSESCVAHFQAAQVKGELNAITGKIEPRGVLFQEDSTPKHPAKKITFWLGYFMLLGLVCGGMSAYIALQKGLPGFNHFLLGFFLNFIGIILVALKRAEVMRFHAEGLVKIPATHTEVVCPKCGHHLHPAAKRCNACNATMQPAVSSEVEILYPKNIINE